MLKSLIIDGEEISAKNIDEIHIENGFVTVKHDKITPRRSDNVVTAAKIEDVKFFDDACKCHYETIKQDFKNAIQGINNVITFTTGPTNKDSYVEEIIVETDRKNIDCVNGGKSLVEVFKKALMEVVDEIDADIQIYTGGSIDGSTFKKLFANLKQEEPGD